jgi:hypothetical protein
LSGTAPSLTYTPASNYNGADSFTFKANDGKADSNTATVSITVTAVNDPPTISNIIDTATNEDTPTGAISFTVGDVETAPGSLTVGGSSSNTSLVPNANIVFGGSGGNRTVTITPAPNQNGTTMITVSVSDGTATTSDTFVLTVNAVNDAPIANPQSVTTNEDTAEPITLTASDVEGDALTFIVVASPAHGTLSGSAPNVTYTPAANYNGADSFTFKANDGTADSNIATVSITVTPVNDPPVANPQSIATTTAVNITLTGSDIETPAAGLTYTITVPPAHGTLSGTVPNLTYTPAAGFHGADSFNFTVTDTGDGASPPLTSPEATVSISSNGPEIAVEQPAGNDLTDGTGVVDFGAVGRGKNVSVLFTIKNKGTANLTGLSITFDGANASEFKVMALPRPPVAPGGSTTFVVRFAPKALGVRTAALHISSNDADENPFDLSLTGAELKKARKGRH